MKKNYNSLIPKTDIAIKILLIIILVSFVAGCSITSVNHLRDAQASFSEAAALENQITMGNLDPFAAKDMNTAIGNMIAIKNGYASALISINKIYPSEKEQLRDDKILGHVLFLKAMSQWRIGDFDNALKIADLAEREASDQLYPRDAAVFAALPGLIKTDLAYKKIEGMAGKTDEEKLKIFNGAISSRLSSKEGGAVYDIMLARKKVNKKHEVNLYLIQAQLSAYRNYQVAHQLSHNTASPLKEDENRTEALYNLQDLKNLLNVLKKSDTIVNYWVGLCSIRPKERQ